MPVARARLYLAEILPSETDQVGMGAFDRANSPTTITDPQGSFIFEDVTPGEYGLILDQVRQAYLLRVPDAEDPLLIQVEEGRGTQLGQLTYPTLPLLPTPE